jgi:hypothetical protein
LALVGSACVFKEIINCENFVQVILGQFFPELTEGEELYQWFQKISGTAHTARMFMKALSNVFGNKTVSSDIWPPRSPILIFVIFFSSGGSKKKIYSANPRTEEELKKIFVGKLQIFLHSIFKG